MGKTREEELSFVIHKVLQGAGSVFLNGLSMLWYNVSSLRHCADGKARRDSTLDQPKSCLSRLTLLALALLRLTVLHGRGTVRVGGRVVSIVLQGEIKTLGSVGFSHLAARVVQPKKALPTHRAIDQGTLDVVVVPELVDHITVRAANVDVSAMLRGERRLQVR